ncbi:alpha/beta fold hydrolase [Xylophilus sp.]|uniref:alpha/beta fold hydrolase n=1 Tax=Xylophilus sp. TaxID=2653893 RepID=UPI002D7E46C0|nr:alpha/beta fold hydrolase [Xylophilus sp.]
MPKPEPSNPVANGAAGHALPFFWPPAAAARMEGSAFGAAARFFDFLGKAAQIDHPPPPAWHTPNTVRLDLPTMRLRQFGHPGKGVPVLIDAPFAGHGATIAAFDERQSLVAALIGAGTDAVWVTDWKSATQEMRYFSIDTYLEELNVAIDELGGRVSLVGLCQGGWLSAMLAARFPHKVASLVLAGSPIDTDAGHGPIRQLAHTIPLSTYEKMVDMGGGRMPGRFMLAGWKNMHPDQQYLRKYVDLFEHAGDADYVARTKHFESWYENPLDLPGSYYLQAIRLLFKENLFAKGRFTGLGRTLSLKDITCPTYLLAGEDDDITTKEQVFAAKDLLGTPAHLLESALVPGGHIGLFMGHRTIAETWPVIGRWILSQRQDAGRPRVR